MSTGIETAEIVRVPIEQVVESKLNPRRTFVAESIIELAENIRVKGIRVPLVVRPILKGGKYEIVAGARRFRAAALAHLSEVPVIVRELTDEEAREWAIIDNLHRENVHPLDEAEGYVTLMKDHGHDVQYVATQVGKSPSYIYQRMKLATLIEPARKALRTDNITVAHALIIARLESDQQKEALAFCNDRYNGLPSIIELTREIESEILLDLNSVSFPKKDETLFPQAGACTTCPKRTGFNKELFEDITKKDRCLDPKCFNMKVDAFIKRTIEEHKGQEFLTIDGDSDSIIANKDCKNAKQALIVKGRSKGRLVRVCTAPNCKTCRPYSFPERERSISPAVRAKRKKEIFDNRVEQKFRVQLAQLLLPRVTFPLKRPDLIQIIRHLAGYGNYGYTINDELLKSLGMKPGRLDSLVDDYDDAKRPASSRFNKWPNNQLAGLIMAIVINPDMIVDPLLSIPEGNVINSFADRYAKGAEIETLKAKARASLGKCEICRCTEQKACEGGCSWDMDMFNEGRFICSRCIAKNKLSKKTAKRKNLKTQRRG